MKVEIVQNRVRGKKATSLRLTADNPEDQEVLDDIFRQSFGDVTLENLKERVEGKLPTSLWLSVRMVDQIVLS